MKKWIFVICTLAMVLNINYMAFAAGAETKITNTNEMSVIDI